MSETTTKRRWWVDSDGEIWSLCLEGSTVELNGDAAADYLNALEDAAAALAKISEGDWRIISGSIGPLMDAGFHLAGQQASEMGAPALARLRELGWTPE